MTERQLPRFGYQKQKLAQARSALMAPFPDEDDAFGRCFNACSEGLRDFDMSKVDDLHARNWITTIKNAMDVSGVVNVERGKHHQKAATLSFDDKVAVSNAVDQLASYFTRIHIEESCRYDG